MLHDINYNKIKVLGDLSELAWFVKNHATKDIQGENQPLTEECYKALLDDLEKHIEKFSAAIAGLSKEDKFK